MNERAVELYKQAVTFAYNTAGKDAGKGTVIESLTAGKVAELIVKECAKACEDHPGWSGRMIGEQIKQHFGVKE